MKIKRIIKEELDSFLLENVELLPVQKISDDFTKTDDTNYKITTTYRITVNDNSTLEGSLNLLRRGNKTTLEGSFESVDGDERSYASTNDNEPYKVLATVFDVLKKFVNDYQQRYNDVIDKMVFIPFREEGEVDNRRRIVYVRYLQRLFPEYDIKNKVIGIVLTKKQ